MLGRRASDTIFHLIHLQEKVTHSFFQVVLPVCVLSSPPSPFFSLHLSVILLASCRRFLSSSDLQMNYMLRSSSTRPLARSWTMRSMTWPLCRRPVARFSVLPVLHLECSCLLHIFPCCQQIKRIFSFPLEACLSSLLFFKYAVQRTESFILFLRIF